MCVPFRVSLLFNNIQHIPREMKERKDFFSLSFLFVYFSPSRSMFFFSLFFFYFLKRVGCWWREYEGHAKDEQHTEERFSLFSCEDEKKKRRHNNTLEKKRTEKKWILWPSASFMAINTSISVTHIHTHTHSAQASAERPKPDSPLSLSLSFCCVCVVCPKRTL